MPPRPKCVAVLRFSAAGDLILTGPALAALHGVWPTTRLLLVTHSRLAPLAAGIAGDVAQVVPLVPGQPLRQLAAILRAEGVDGVLDLHGSWRSRALTMLVRPTWRSRWHKRSLYEWAAVTLAHAPYRPTRTMERRYHDAVENLVGGPVTSVAPVFVVTAADVLQAQARLARAQGGLPSDAATTVALLPGAAWATKRWPVAHFAQVGRALLQRGHRVLLLGGPQDAPLTQAIAALAPGALDVGGALGWGAMAHLLGHCQAVVVGDTGPMHLARAAGAPTIALFGSTPAAQFDWADSKALHSDAHCSPCSFYGLKGCPRGHLRCLTDIRPETVVQAVLQTLHAGTKVPLRPA